MSAESHPSSDPPVTPENPNLPSQPSTTEITPNPAPAPQEPAAAAVGCAAVPPADGGLRVSQHVKNRDFWFAGAVAEEKAPYDEDEEPTRKLVQGMLLPKGKLASGRPLTEAEREKHRLWEFNPGSKTYAKRAEPLTDEELECWDYQSSWLCCPISGVSWRDRDAILGVGLYHAPRFLTDDEKKRQADASKRAQAHQKAAAAAAAVAAPEDEADGEGGAEDAEEEGLARQQEGPEFFQVYPSVQPAVGSFKPLGPLPDNVRCGHIEVMIGPVFDIVAYNDGIDGNKAKGILSRKDRGVLDMDQQYNALNFVYFVDDGFGHFQRKVCSNRLSFFIDEEHGSRVFPENIESQLSLLLYRNSRRFKDPNTGETDQVLLAEAIKRVIPKILKAVVRETLSDKAEAAESRLEHAIRTYMLIHQIAIKLILRYPKAYESVFRFGAQKCITEVQNPFTAENSKNWPDIEELLIAASLVGVPWNMMRESFVRKMMAQIMMFSGVMSENVQLHERVKHVFHQNKTMIHRVLYEFSFFIAGSSLFELDKKYARCAGTLPKADRDRMMEAAMAVKECTSFEKFWISMGMDPAWEDEAEVRRHIIKYFEYLVQQVPNWQKVQLSQEALVKIQPPKLESTEKSVATMGVLKFRSEREKQKAAHEAEERKKHEGLPKLNVNGRLDRNQCNFVQCQRKFTNRAHLMQHIRRIFKKEIKVGYHIKHYKLHVKDKSKLTCDACGEVFDIVESIHRHYAMTNVPGWWHGPSHTAELWKAAGAVASQGPAPESAPLMKVDPWDDPGLCVICMDNERDIVFAPCGHLCTCTECGQYLPKCPMCREDIEAVLQVYFAIMKQMKIFSP